MDSDLQHAADKLANRIPIDACERQALAEAARKYANPPPRLELIEEFVTELLRGSIINQNSSNIEGEVRQLVLNLTSRWDAALGVTEDE